MKYVIYFLLSMIMTLHSYAQCKDVYGHKSECPTEADSLAVYNNAIRVYEYYENNSKYEKTRQVPLNSDMDKRNIFEDLATARRLFFVIRRQVGTTTNPTQKKFAAGKPVPSYKDIKYNQYYQEIDDYRFYQRELESQIVNAAAPASLFDVRIAPIIVNEYHCVDTTDPHFGDLVNIPLYVPVTVKPVMLLTEDELESRNQILSKIDANYKPIQIPKPYEEPPIVETQTVEPPIASPIVKTIERPVGSKASVEKPIYLPTVYWKCQFPIPTYAYNPLTGGTIVGFLCGKTFIKIKPDEYKHYAVPDWAKDILENKKSLKDLIKNKFGEYITNIE